MKPLVLTMRAPADQRLDLAPLVPHKLAGMTAAQIERIALHTTRRRVLLADIFHLGMGDAARVRIEGACDRLDQIGQEMTGGEIEVEGDIGTRTGRLMSGGRLTVHGSVGPWAASGMKGGTLEIFGDAGDRLGAPFAGETAGMRGGIVHVGGSVGERAGDRMRRGTILVEGDAGVYAGSRMIAGTLVVVGRSGALPGYLMKRGTIVLGKKAASLSPTFIDCGVHDLVAARLMAAFIDGYSARAAELLSRPVRRFVGDMATLGQGEIFSPA